MILSLHYLTQTTMRHCLLLVACLLIGSASQAQERIDTVSLRFDWPVGLTGRVEQEWFREKITPERADSLHFVSSWRMQVLPHSKGLLIRSDSVVVPQFEGATSDTTEMVQRLLTQLGALAPSYVVGSEGEFIEVADVARMKAAMDTVFAPILAQMGEMPPRAKALFQSMLSEETLTASAAQEWNALVGTWVGADWELGAVYEYEAMEPSPLLPGLVVPMRYQFSATKRIPCTDLEGSPECVELFMLSSPDPDSARSLARKLIEQMGIGAEGDELIEAFESMEVEHELIVVAEPKTLLPYLVVKEKRVRVRIPEAPTQKAGESSQLDRRLYRFYYTDSK